MRFLVSCSLCGSFLTNCTTNTFDLFSCSPMYWGSSFNSVSWLYWDWCDPMSPYTTMLNQSVAEAFWHLTHQMDPNQRSCFLFLHFELGSTDFLQLSLTLGTSCWSSLSSTILLSSSRCSYCFSVFSVWLSQGSIFHCFSSIGLGFGVCLMVSFVLFLLCSIRAWVTSTSLLQMANPHFSNFESG